MGNKNVKCRGLISIACTVSFLKCTLLTDGKSSWKIWKLYETINFKSWNMKMWNSLQWLHLLFASLRLKSALKCRDQKWKQGYNCKYEIVEICHWNKAPQCTLGYDRLKRVNSDLPTQPLILSASKYFR